MGWPSVLGKEQGSGWATLLCGAFPAVEFDFGYHKMPGTKNLAKMLVDGGSKFSKTSILFLLFHFTIM
jgi:hypothetical protein